MDQLDSGDRGKMSGKWLLPWHATGQVMIFVRLYSSTTQDELMVDSGRTEGELKLLLVCFDRKINQA